MLKVASCDSQGSVYLAGDVVYRTVDRNHEDHVRKVLKLLKTVSLEGIVATEVCSDAEVFAGIDDAMGRLVLKHKRISRISYAHEWCASMLKDCALFHVQLSQQLMQQDLFLKDAHPWNVLIESGHPVFVDFTSVVSSESLLAEDYLLSNHQYRQADRQTRLAMVTGEIFERMYLPYFLNPLLAYAFGQRKLVSKRLLKTTLNASTSKMTLRQCLPKKRPVRKLVKKIYRLYRQRLLVDRLLARLRRDRDVPGFYQRMQKLVSSLEVAAGSSGYASYYVDKGEDQAAESSEQWNAKQKSVCAAIDDQAIRSVLDVACNTGWFAVMAEELGKSVVAFDIDEGCIEALYQRVKTERLDILPLVMNLTDMTPDRYSIYDGNKVLINAPERLRSDSVLALGIIHHLVLGLGLSFDEVLELLLSLCEKQLVIEFVALDDEMILNQSSFFPAYHENKEVANGYELRGLIEICKHRGFDVRCADSHPSTRTIVICSKKDTR